MMVHLRPALLSAEHCNKDMSCNVPNPHWSSYARELQGPITKRKGRKQSKLTSKANLSPLSSHVPFSSKEGHACSTFLIIPLISFCILVYFSLPTQIWLHPLPQMKAEGLMFDTGEQIKRTKFNQQSKHSIKATIIITTIMVNAVV